MAPHNDPASPTEGADTPKVSLRRACPLVLVVVVSGVVVAMGWHRQLSFETLARHHEALGDFIALHEVSAVGAYIPLYIPLGAPSMPVGVYFPGVGGNPFRA